MQSIIHHKMQVAGLAYQQFLLATSSDEQSLEALKMARFMAEQYTDKLLSILDNTDLSDLPQYEQLHRKNLALQNKVKAFSNQFEALCLTSFEQFKKQQSALIVKDPVMAFRQWTDTFDTEYLAYMHQPQVCRDYAALLSACAGLAQLASTQQQP